MAAAGTGQQTSYDEIPYPELCYSLTHPGRLAAIGRLLGMEPARVQDCRVLEIGCAGGGNIVPMAMSLPGSTFVGIDLSPRQVATASELAGELGLANVRFIAMDLMDVTAELGEFDYIIAHGMYSWVPAAVADRILSICAEHLAPMGVAYVSYNTFPGWHMLQMVREMMLFRTRDITDPRRRAHEARAVIERMRSSILDVDDSVVGSFLDAYVDTRLANFAGDAAWADSALLHDELGPVNEPVYFHQFVAHAQRHGLQYLAEATFPQATHDLPAETVTGLAAMADDVIEMEQYLDFARQQSFRRTLLCHDAVDVQRTARPHAIADLHLTSRARPVPMDDRQTVFTSTDGSTFISERALTTAALTYLVEVSPRAIHFGALLDEACRRAGCEPDTATAEELAADLLDAASVGSEHTEVLADDPVLTPLPSERPTASPLVRLQVQRSTIVATLRHEQMALNGLSRALVPLLDGTQTRSDVLRQLLAMLGDGRMSSALRSDIGPAEIAQQLTDDIERTLRWLGRAGILLA